MNECACGGEHVVRFYESDAFLVESVGQFVAEGLPRGARGLIVATAEHATEIVRWLRAAKIPVDELLAARRIVVLDAAETLRRIAPDGELDEARFRDVAGGLVRELAQGGEELRVFGEIVALLWQAGKPDDAIRLEEFWNRLATEHRFHLLCAYPIRGFQSHPEARRFSAICRSHQRVLPAESFQPQAGLSDEQSRQIAVLQQRAAALEAEMAERERTEEKLRRREAELTAFVESAAIGLHWVDAEGRILWANRAELELLGYAWDDYVGRHISEFHADAPVIDDILARLCRGEKLRDYEARLRGKDGAIKTVLIDSSVLWDNGRFVHTQCFTRDVTEQRRAENATHHLAAIVQGSDDAIVSKNLEGVIQSWNPGAERIFGYRRDEVLGRSITLLIPAERLHEEDMILSRLRRGERLEHFETVRRRKDGRLIDVSLTISPVRDAKGRVVGASKIARDITEQKLNALALERARTELARANTELEQQVADLRQLHELTAKFQRATGVQALLEEILAAALEVNRTDKGLLSLATPGHEGLRVAASRGFDAEFLHGIAFVPSGRGACGDCHARRQRVVIEDAQQDPLFADYRELVRRAGVRGVHSTPLVARDGRLIGVLSAHHAEPRQPSERERQLMDLYARHAADLIENARLREELERELEGRRATAQQLEVARDELARINRELEERVRERTASLTDLLAQMETFSYTVSHDLRAPLRAMAGYARILESDYAARLDEDGLHYVQRIIRASDRMNRLIGDVLAYARVNRDRLEMAPLSLTECASQVIQHVPELQAPRATISLQPDAPLVLGNEAFLTQIFANLFGNAVKFIAPGREPAITVSFEREGDFVRTEVRDNGIGIKPEQQGRLFGLFERLHGDKCYDGTGIGLAIVKRAVERMGGTVGVVSDGANGSRFWFTLRAAPVRGSASPAAKPGVPSGALAL